MIKYIFQGEGQFGLFVIDPPYIQRVYSMVHANPCLLRNMNPLFYLLSIIIIIIFPAYHDSVSCYCTRVVAHLADLIIM